MNILKVKKPLIEWEKELDIWLVDISLDDHFVSYNKMDAFDKINILCVKRGWSDAEYNIYNDYLSKQFPDCLALEEFKNSNNYNYHLSEVKSLIEWERERGIWIPDLCFADHLRLYNKKDAFTMLRKPTVMWNDESERMYLKYLSRSKNKNNSSMLENKVEHNSNIIFDLRDKVEKIGFKDKFNNFNLRNKFENIDLKDRFSNIDIKNKIERINFKKKLNIFQSRKSNNKSILKKNILKRSVALLMGITTSLSAYAYYKLNMINNYDNTYGSYVSAVSDSCESIVNNSNYDEIFCENLVENKSKENQNINKDIQDNSNYSMDGFCFDNDCDDIDDDKYLYIVSDQSKQNEEVESNHINIGSQVKIESDSNIYGNCIDAMNNTNGMEPYYSYDYDRVVTGVCVKYDDSILYLDDSMEVDNYIDDGASIVSYSTMIDNGICEGFYSADDVKIKVKQI